MWRQRGRWHERRGLGLGGRYGRGGRGWWRQWRYRYRRGWWYWHWWHNELTPVQLPPGIRFKHSPLWNTRTEVCPPERRSNLHSGSQIVKM